MVDWVYRRRKGGDEAMSRLFLLADIHGEWVKLVEIPPHVGTFLLEFLRWRWTVAIKLQWYEE